MSWSATDTTMTEYKNLYNSYIYKKYKKKHVVVELLRGTVKHPIVFLFFLRRLLINMGLKCTGCLKAACVKSTNYTIVFVALQRITIYNTTKTLLQCALHFWAAAQCLL